MTNIELYIDNVLVDTGQDFSVRLNRQLINPSELNTKDAQFSYSVSLPPTAVNHTAFKFANIEETKGKFNREYNAELIINSVRIFVGKFRLSETSRNGYKGNLYLPAVKSVRDIFADLNLNAVPEYRIAFADFATSISNINTAALASPQMAIFPYVLYGLLPKVPLNLNANLFSARNLWDASVRYNMQDVPPSINPLLMLKHIFNSQGYTLSGSAFNDKRLSEVYQSYKNSPEYVQPWNYGYHARISLSGAWSSTRNKRNADATQYERGVYQTSDRGYNIYTADLFNSTNADISVSQDPGGNVLYKEVSDTSGMVWEQTQIRIPASGYYKIRFVAGVQVYSNADWRHTDPATGVQHVSGDGDHHINDMLRRVYEIKLLRDRKTGDFGLSTSKLDGGFYEPNQPQTQDPNQVPKYFPQVPPTGQLNYIDQLQNRKHLLGFGFGSRDGINNIFPSLTRPDNHFYNPKDVLFSFAQMQAGKPGLSWDASETDVNRIGVNGPGYWKYGRLGHFDSEGDNPDVFMDYSAGPFVYGKILDQNGNPADAPATNINARIPGVYISNTTGLQVPADGYEATEFIQLSEFGEMAYTSEISPNPNAAEVAYYDENKFYLNEGVNAPAEGGGEGFAIMAANPLTPPSQASFVRLSGNSGGLIVNGVPASAGNVILHRLDLDAFYTYEVEAPGYGGFAYIHNGNLTTPAQVVPFVNGLAVFNTALGFTLRPKLTLYLKTQDFDVQGVLTIKKIIAPSSSTVIGWELTNKYRQQINNSPDNYVYRLNNWQGNGEINAIVWLEAGELLTVADVSEEGLYRRNGMHTTSGWTNHECFFGLEIVPFRVDLDWLKIDMQGHGTAVMNWNDPVNFDTDSINLAGFLPADMKVNDYIENFVKAFNLKLSQVSPTAFSLDVKQSKTALSTRSINLDGIASIKDRSNTPLGLPRTYKLGFTVNTEEEGYFLTGDDGGGEYNTGSIEDTVIEQKSSFSYNWFKPILRGGITLQLPVISKRDVWVGGTPYGEAMTKRYTDLAMRFWYMDGFLPGDFTINDTPVKFAKVSNSRPDSVLNYKTVPQSILTNYFTLLGIGSDSHYTEAEAYLTPYQYADLDGSLMVSFNSDLYYAAQIDGYDPAAKNKTKLKLIRKI